MYVYILTNLYDTYIKIYSGIKMDCYSPSYLSACTCRPLSGLGGCTRCDGVHLQLADPVRVLPQQRYLTKRCVQLVPFSVIFEVKLKLKHSLKHANIGRVADILIRMQTVVSQCITSMY